MKTKTCRERRVGPQMRRVVELVRLAPGCSKKYIASRISPLLDRGCQADRNWSLGYAPVNRALWAGLIVSSYYAGRYHLYTPDHPSRPSALCS